MKHLPASVRTFASIEQLDELPRELGWPLEYRQLEPGPFSSTFTDLEGDAWFLMEERSSRRVEIEAAAPAGMFMLAVFEGDPGAVNGKSIGPDDVFLQAPDSDFLATLPASMTATQIGIADELFEEVIQAVAPDLRVPYGETAVFAAAPGRLESARRAMRTAILAPSIRAASQEEAVSRILTDIVSVAFDRGKASSGRDLHRAYSRRVLCRAREYIEAHLDDAIRVEAICRCAGTSIRSLDRIFAREMNTSPQQYVKARRLSAVRRRFLAISREQGPSITEVAQSLGFTHMGRFSVDYRRYFGESPRETLYRR